MNGRASRALRVLVVDDEELVRSGLVMLLEAAGISVVAEAADGAESVRLAVDLRPDVVLMDVRLAGSDGIEATRRVLAAAEAADRGLPAVLILTTFNDDEAVVRALRAGASGFLLKSAATTDLVRAVHAVANGAGWLDPAVTKALLADFAARPDLSLPTSDELERLTRREIDVLRLVAHGLSNGEIARELVISEATAKTHVSRLMLKLGARDRTQAAVTAYRLGLVLPTDRPPSRPGGW